MADLQSEAVKQQAPAIIQHVMDFNPAYSIILSSLSLVVSLVVSFGAIYSIWILIRQLKSIEKQAKVAETSQSSKIFFTISEKWTQIYKQRNTLLSSPLMTVEQLETEFGSNYKKLFEKSHWIDVRMVCNFFESLGVMIEQQAIPLNLLFALVTVDVYKDIDDKELQIEVPEGVMYSRLKPYIQYLRKHYRPDIYLYYDNLLHKYKLHLGKDRL